MSQPVEAGEATREPATASPPEDARPESTPSERESAGVSPSVELSTVGTGSYVAVSCAATMGLLTLILIAGLLISRWVS